MPHKLGQVFLHDFNIIRNIVRDSGISNDDPVVEIGCGEGVLTQELAKQARTLSVIEIDSTCITATKARLDPMPDLCPITYYHEDVLKHGLSTVEHDNCHVVANIPYYISAKIVKRLIEDRDKLVSATLMVQREFANKLLANPGDKDYTSLNIYASYYFDIKKCFPVSRTCFKPVPRVDSMVIRLTPLATPPIDIGDNEDTFFAMVRSGFWGRRKPLLSALKKSPYLAFDGDIGKLDFFKTHPNVRAETLTLFDFYTLWTELSAYVKPKLSKETTLPQF